MNKLLIEHDKNIQSYYDKQITFESLKEKGYPMLDHRTRKLAKISKKQWWQMLFK
tara:strand:- start:4718 stop:4882 length:165 start_codon:yes stop_codon:yes gene_type:complete